MPVASIRSAEDSGAGTGGVAGGIAGGVGPDGGGVEGGVGPDGGVGVGPEGGVGVDGLPGGRGVPEPIGKDGSGGAKTPTGETPGTAGGVAIVVAGGGVTGISAGAGVSILANSTPPSAISIAADAGSFLAFGATGTVERRFPHRVRAMFAPSLRTVSPARIVTAFFVQKISLPIRYET